MPSADLTGLSVLIVEDGNRCGGVRPGGCEGGRGRWIGGRGSVISIQQPGSGVEGSEQFGVRNAECGVVGFKFETALSRGLRPVRG